MAQYSVTFQQIKSAMDTLNQLAGDFKNAVNNLESTEGQLCSMWEGEAKDTFDKAFKQDKVQMDNFYNAIIAYVHALEQILAKYQTTEAANMEIASTRNYQ